MAAASSPAAKPLLDRAGRGLGDDAGIQAGMEAVLALIHPVFGRALELYSGQPTGRRRFRRNTPKLAVLSGIELSERAAVADDAKAPAGSMGQRATFGTGIGTDRLRRPVDVFIERLRAAMLATGDASILDLAGKDTVRKARASLERFEYHLSRMLSVLKKEATDLIRAGGAPSKLLKAQVAIAAASVERMRTDLEGNFPYRQGVTRIWFGSAEGQPATWEDYAAVVCGGAALVAGVTANEVIARAGESVTPDVAAKVAVASGSVALIGGALACCFRVRGQFSGVRDQSYWLRAGMTCAWVGAGLAGITSGALALSPRGITPGPHFGLTVPGAAVRLTPHSPVSTWQIKPGSAAVNVTSGADPEFDACFSTMGAGANVTLRAENGTEITEKVPGSVCLRGNANATNYVLNSIYLTAEGRRFIAENTTLAVTVTAIDTGEKHNGTIVDAAINPWPEVFKFHNPGGVYDIRLEQGQRAPLFTGGAHLEATEGSDLADMSIQFVGLPAGAILNVFVDGTVHVVTPANPKILLKDDVRDLNVAFIDAEIQVVVGPSDAAGAEVRLHAQDDENGLVADAALGQIEFGPAPESYFNVTTTPVDGGELIPGAGERVPLLNGTGVVTSSPEDRLQTRFTITVPMGVEVDVVVAGGAHHIVGTGEQVVIPLPSMNAADLNAALAEGHIEAIEGSEGVANLQWGLHVTDPEFPGGERDATAELGHAVVGPDPNFTFTDDTPGSGTLKPGESEHLSGQFSSAYPDVDTVAGAIIVSWPDRPDGASCVIHFNGVDHEVNGKTVEIPFEGELAQVNTLFADPVFAIRVVGVPPGAGATSLKVNVQAEDEFGEEVAGELGAFTIAAPEVVLASALPAGAGDDAGGWKVAKRTGRLRGVVDTEPAAVDPARKRFQDLVEAFGDDGVSGSGRSRAARRRRAKSHHEAATAAAQRGGVPATTPMRDAMSRAAEEVEEHCSWCCWGRD